ncbi:hypothetical protein DITRI_Ditri09bG0118300 [Diplodiscus trichospermus]
MEWKIFSRVKPGPLERMPDRDVTSWNAMLIGFEQLGFLDKVFDGMRFAGILPDSVTVVGLSLGVLSAKSLDLVKGVHSFGIQIGVAANIKVANTWIAVYAKCGDLASAKKVFDEIDAVRTVISWNSMIAGYANSENFPDAFDLYRRMLVDGIRPDASSIASLVSSCVQPEALFQGMLIHSHGIQLGCDLNLSVTNTIISMYSKCGRVSWTVMIIGYAEKGNMDQAMSLFYSMEKSGETPDISPGLDNYSCMVDLLGRKGKVIEALEFIINMPIRPDAGMWSALLSACKVHHNVEIATGKWEGVATVRLLMKQNNVSKSPGQSLVHVNGKLHSFTVEDRSHPENELFWTESATGEVSCAEAYQYLTKDHSRVIYGGSNIGPNLFRLQDLAFSGGYCLNALILRGFGSINRCDADFGEQLFCSVLLLCFSSKAQLLLVD